MAYDHSQVYRLDVELVRFETIEFVAVLVDDLHDVLKELLQGVRTEVQRDQVRGEVTLCLQHLLGSILLGALVQLRHELLIKII